MEQPKTNYTDLWARKMRKIFCLLDTKKQGYITEDTLLEQFKVVSDAYPEIREDTLMKQYQHTWKHLYNNGQETPKGHRLTEEAFINNMWVTVNQANFMQEIERMSKDSFDQMDLQHKGYITKDEYVKMIVKSVGEERAVAIFDAMDTDHKGELHFKELVRAKHFFYTDVSDESNPINLMHGPLE